MVLYRAWTLPSNVVRLFAEHEHPPLGVLSETFDMTDAEAQEFNDASSAYSLALCKLSNAIGTAITINTDDGPVAFSRNEVDAIGYMNLSKAASQIRSTTLTRDEALAAVVDELTLGVTLGEPGPVTVDIPPVLEETITDI